jgi:hypothetical protein
LRCAQRPAVGAAKRRRIPAQLPRQQQELSKFAAEEFGARRIVEGQGRQRIDLAICAGRLPIVGFDPQYRDQIFSSNSAGSGDAFDLLAMQLPVVSAGVDSCARNEALAVPPPGQGRLGRLVHRRCKLRTDPGGGQSRRYLIPGKAVLADDPIDEFRDLRPIQIKPGLDDLQFIGLRSRLACFILLRLSRLTDQ